MTSRDAVITHVLVRSQCGICERRVSRDDPFILLYGNSNSTAFSCAAGPFTRRGGNFCKTPRCRDCALEKEASTVHVGCYEFTTKIAQLGDSRSMGDRIWINTAWRAPWRWVSNLNLEAHVVLPDRAVLSNLGLSGMAQLPLEVLDMIREHSDNSQFWRYNTTLDFARRLESLPSTPRKVVVSLSRVRAWERGQPPIIEEAGGPHFPIMRLTIDVKGVHKIERFAEHPPFKPGRTDRLAFGVLDEDSMMGISAVFKFDRVRLEIPTSKSAPEIWDTPTPPGVDRCIVRPRPFSSSSRIDTIDLGKITGLTFFFVFRSGYTVHAHTAKEPKAKHIYHSLDPDQQCALKWVYVPVPAADSIVAFGMQFPESGEFPYHDVCILVRLKLAGDVFVGPSFPRYGTNFFITKSLPITVAFSKRVLTPLNGIWCEHPGITNEEPFTRLQVDRPIVRGGCYSFAPLKNVIQVTIYDSRTTSLSPGIVLEYRDGSQRALGQARLGVDRAHVYKKPYMLCFQMLLRNAGDLGDTNITPPHNTHFMECGSKIRCQTTRSHTHTKGPWKCCPLEGRLEFWFSDKESRLRYISESDLADS